MSSFCFSLTCFTFLYYPFLIDCAYQKQCCGFQEVSLGSHYLFLRFKQFLALFLKNCSYWSNFETFRRHSFNANNSITSDVWIAIANIDMVKMKSFFLTKLKIYFMTFWHILKSKCAILLNIRIIKCLMSAQINALRRMCVTMVFKFAVTVKLFALSDLL
jgi:hypothetical protein